MGLCVWVELNRKRLGYLFWRVLVLLESRRDHWLFHDDLAQHVGMNAAEVRVLAWFGEGERVAVVGVEGVRLELLCGILDGVGNVVVVDPGNGSSGEHFDGLRREREVVDRNLSGLGRCARGAEQIVFVDEREAEGDCGDDRCAERGGA